MGCFNETCLISNVHITHKDEVAVVLLQQDDRSYESYCYSNSYYDTAPLMFYGKYNDYGSVEDIKESASFDILLDRLKENLVEIEQGPNKYHDIAVTRKNFNIEMLLEACWENRMAVKSIYKAKNEIRYAFIHKTVLDAILTEFTLSDYGRDTKGKFREYTYNFSTMAQDIPEYVRRLCAKLEEISKLESMEIELWKIESRNKFDLFEKNEINLAAKYMQFGHGESSREVIFGPIQFLCEHGLYFSEEDLIEFVTELLKMRWVNFFMHASNKVWIKPMSAGQVRDWKPFELLNKAVAKVIADDKAYYDEGNDEEDPLQVDPEPYSVSLEERPNFHRELVKHGY